ASAYHKTLSPVHKSKLWVVRSKCVAAMEEDYYSAQGFFCHEDTKTSRLNFAPSCLRGKRSRAVGVPFPRCGNTLFPTTKLRCSIVPTARFVVSYQNNQSRGVEGMRHQRRGIKAFLSLGLLVFFCFIAFLTWASEPGQTAGSPTGQWLTFGHDPQRSGWAADE